MRGQSDDLQPSRGFDPGGVTENRADEQGLHVYLARGQQASRVKRPQAELRCRQRREPTLIHRDGRATFDRPLANLPVKPFVAG